MAEPGYEPGTSSSVGNRVIIASPYILWNNSALENNPTAELVNETGHSTALPLRIHTSIYTYIHTYYIPRNNSPLDNTQRQRRNGTWDISITRQPLYR